MRAAQAEDVVSIDSLTGLLAARVMGWGVRPDRFLIKGRQWMPRWRFQPADRLEDAFRLLDAADPSEYSIYRQGSLVSVRVLIAGRVGEARDSTHPRAITFAVAQAIGLDPTTPSTPKTGADRR